MQTAGDIYLDVRAAFKRAELAQPDFLARQLICFALGWTQEQLQNGKGLFVSTETQENIHKMSHQLMAGEPLAYIIGQWDFMDITLEITRDVLIPRPETELLAQLAIEELETRGGGAMLDLCCGSGCIGLAAASHFHESGTVEIMLADHSIKALAVAKRNALKLGLDVRVTEADALSAPLKAIGPYDVIACNPPYISDGEYHELDEAVRLYEPAMALRGGEDGLDFYRSLARYWAKALKPGGRILLEVGCHQAEAVTELLRRGAFTKLTEHQDLFGVTRVVTGCT